MAEPKYDKEAHAQALIKTLAGMGYTVTKGKPASTKAHDPKGSGYKGPSPAMAKSSGGPITNPAQRVAAGSAPGPTPSRYNPFPNTPGMGGRVHVGPPGSIGAQQQGYSPMSGGGPPRMPQQLPQGVLPQGPPGSIGAQRPFAPRFQFGGMGDDEQMGSPAFSPMQGGPMPNIGGAPIDMMNQITGEQQQQPWWNPFPGWTLSNLMGR